MHAPSKTGGAMLDEVPLHDAYGPGADEAQSGDGPLAGRVKPPGVAAQIKAAPIIPVVGNLAADRRLRGIDNRFWPAIGVSNDAAAGVNDSSREQQPQCVHGVPSARIMAWAARSHARTQ